MIFFNWQLSGISAENILMHSLFVMLQLVEMLSQMQVLALLHISICITTRGLAGYCQELKDADFGVFDMNHTVDLIETTFNVTNS